MTTMRDSYPNSICFWVLHDLTKRLLMLLDFLSLLLWHVDLRKRIWYNEWYRFLSWSRKVIYHCFKCRLMHMQKRTFSWYIYGIDRVVKMWWHETEKFFKKRTMPMANSCPDFIGAQEGHWHPVRDCVKWVGRYLSSVKSLKDTKLWFM